jgi:hypothetical protein
MEGTSISFFFWDGVFFDDFVSDDVAVFFVVEDFLEADVFFFWPAFGAGFGPSSFLQPATVIPTAVKTARMKIKNLFIRPPLGKPNLKQKNSVKPYHKIPWLSTVISPWKRAA